MFATPCETLLCCCCQKQVNTIKQKASGVGQDGASGNTGEAGGEVLAHTSVREQHMTVPWLPSTSSRQSHTVTVASVTRQKENRKADLILRADFPASSAPHQEHHKENRGTRGRTGSSPLDQGKAQRLLQRLLVSECRKPKGEVRMTGDRAEALSG